MGVAIPMAMGVVIPSYLQFLGVSRTEGGEDLYRSTEPVIFTVVIVAIADVVLRRAPPAGREHRCQLLPEPLTTVSVLGLDLAGGQTSDLVEQCAAQGRRLDEGRRADHGRQHPRVLEQTVVAQQRANKELFGVPVDDDEARAIELLEVAQDVVGGDAGGCCCPAPLGDREQPAVPQASLGQQEQVEPLGTW